MKKISAVLLIAVLASGLVFAGFSGSATIGVGANFDNGQYGFIDKGTNVKFNFDIATASGEAKGDGSIYAEIKGSLKLFMLTDADGIKGGDPLSFTTAKITTGDTALALIAKIDSAKIIGSNWYVGLLGVPSVPDFAKSAIDTWTVEDKTDDYGVKKADYDEKATYKVGYEKAPGVEVGVAGYKFGFGMLAKAEKTPEFKLFDKLFLTAYAATPEYELADGLTLQVGATYSKAELKAGEDETYGKSATNAVGASVKVAYASDEFSASVASDIGYNLVKDVADPFGADVALNVAYAPVTVDAYYATLANVGKDEKPDAAGTDIKNLLSVKAVVDLNTFDVPVKVIFTGKDLVNKQDLSASVEVAVMEGFTLTPKGGFAIADNKWNAGLDAKYVADAFTVKAGASVKALAEKDAALQLGASASIESAAIVPGATLKLAWSDGKDLLNKIASETKNYGKIVASAKIEF